MTGPDIPSGGKPLELALKLEAPKDLLARYYPNGKLGGLILDGPAPAVLGRRCALTVRFSQPAGRHLRVLGQLAWVRHRSSAGLPACFGVDFVGEDEAGRARLFAFANGHFAAEATRAHDRLDARLPVKISHQGETWKEQLFDLSQSGAFVRSRSPLPVGSGLTFRLRPPGSLTSIRLQGRVAWVREGGAGQGMGVQFAFDNDRQRERIRRLLERIRRRSSTEPLD